MDAVAVVVGEALVDVVESPDGTVVERPGGSAANTAVALGRLGRPVRLATSYAADGRGRLLEEHLAGSGVGLASDPYVVPRTSVARARIGADGGASYDFDVAWRLGPVAEPRIHVLHVGSFAPLLGPGSEDVLALVDRLESETTVSYDLNIRPAVTGTGPEIVDRVERMVGRADLVKASDEDLAVLWPDLDDREAAEHLTALGPAAVVVTHGAGGAVWHGGRNQTEEVPARPVRIVDTIGAGDTFAAGLLDALWEHLGEGGRQRLAAVPADGWVAALDHAAVCAAVTVSRPGADPPWRSEIG